MAKIREPKLKVFCVSKQAGIKIAGRNINNLRYADDTTLMAESEEELKSLLMEVKVESEKVGLKLNIQKTMFMASGPIISWVIDGKRVETVFDFILEDNTFLIMCFLIFGCTGSWLLCTGVLIAVSRAYSSLRCIGSLLMASLVVEHGL